MYYVLIYLFIGIIFALVRTLPAIHMGLKLNTKGMLNQLSMALLWPGDIVCMIVFFIKIYICNDKRYLDYVIKMKDELTINDEEES